VEFARTVLGLSEPHTLEYTLATPDPVIHLLPTQLGVADKGGTMRLGAYDCRLAEGSLAQRLYGVPDAAPRVSERHRHRYEVNNAYRERFRAAGFLPSGINPELDVVEIMELRDHPFFVGVQYHPEFKS